MASDHGQPWPPELTGQTASDNSEVAPQVKKKFITAQGILAVFVAVVSVATWENLLVPAWEYFNSPYELVNQQVSPEVGDLMNASIKNCLGKSYNRRACKSVWANVSIPSVEQVATVTAPK